MPDVKCFGACLCDIALIDALYVNLQDFQSGGANIHQIVFWRTLSLSQWYRMSMALDLFCSIVSFKMPKAVELSVRNGIAGCLCPSSMRVTLRGAPLCAL